MGYHQEVESSVWFSLTVNAWSVLLCFLTERIRESLSYNNNSSSCLTSENKQVIDQNISQFPSHDNCSQVYKQYIDKKKQLKTSQKKTKKKFSKTENGQNNHLPS